MLFTCGWTILDADEQAVAALPESARSMRDVLLGADVPVTLTRRAAGMLEGLRSDAIGRVHPDGLMISRDDQDLRWWTWAGIPRQRDPEGHPVRRLSR